MKKLITLFVLAISVAVLTGCKDKETQAVAYSIGTMAGSWSGDEDACIVVQKYLIENFYQITNAAYEYPKDEEMIVAYDGKLAALKKEIEDGKIQKVLHDQEMTAGKIKFDYVLLSSRSGTMESNTVEFTY